MLVCSGFPNQEPVHCNLTDTEGNKLPWTNSSEFVEKDGYQSCAISINTDLELNANGKIKSTSQSHFLILFVRANYT